MVEAAPIARPRLVASGRRFPKEATPRTVQVDPTWARECGCEACKASGIMHTCESCEMARIDEALHGLR